MIQLFKGLIFLFFSVAPGADHGKLKYSSIKDVKFEKLLKIEECTSDSIINDISFEKISGLDDIVALVTGSTCMTGTAGPDIHAAYILESQYPKKLIIQDTDGKFKGVNYLAKLNGNRNYRFVVKDSQLQEVWHDKWGSAYVTFTFRWDGKQFSAIDAKYEKSPAKHSADK